MSLHFRYQQQGAALIVSLILLGVISILALSSAYSANTEMKVVASQKERGVAFQAAEAALAQVEQQLATNPPPIEMLWETCNGQGCFTSTCTGGLCFAGSFPSNDSQYSCKTVRRDADIKRVPFWEDPVLNVWESAGRHREIEVTSVKATVKYIVEFMCYVRKDSMTPFDGSETNENNGAPLFRITALASSNGGRAKVALQSTFKLINNI